MQDRLTPAQCAHNVWGQRVKAQATTQQLGRSVTLKGEFAALRTA